MLEKLTFIKRWVDRLLAGGCAFLLSFMTLLVLYQVFTRYVLNDPASFTEELVRYSLIWTGFIGAAYAFSTRQHMALLLFRNKLPEGPRRLLITASDILILLLAIFVITLGGAALAASASHEFSALLGVPRTLVYAIDPIAGVFIILVQLINIYEDVTGIKIETGTRMAGAKDSTAREEIGK